MTIGGLGRADGTLSIGMRFWRHLIGRVKAEYKRQVCHVYRCEAGRMIASDTGAPTRYVAPKPSPNRLIAGNNRIKPD